MDRKTGIIWDSVVVFPGKKTRGKGRPDRCAVPVDFVEGGVLLFETLAGEEVVLGLVRDGSNEIMFCGDVMGVLTISWLLVEGRGAVVWGVPRSQRQTTPKFPSRELCQW